ncbi:MAG: hypothetical protein PUE85_06200 [Firmicutes bacterium]|nr:hypothetical protein [Bacillota bacterium]
MNVLLADIVGSAFQVLANQKKMMQEAFAELADGSFRQFSLHSLEECPAAGEH